MYKFLFLTIGYDVNWEEKAEAIECLHTLNYSEVDDKVKINQL